jgi:hypothetical protein
MDSVNMQVDESGYDIMVSEMENLPLWFGLTHRDDPAAFHGDKT